MKSIRAHLLIGLLFGTLVCTLAAAMLLYSLADHEADEQSDQRLRQLAWALPLQLGTNLRVPPEPDADDQFLVQLWDAQGTLVYTSEAGSALPRTAKQGYSSVTYAGARWRIYMEQRQDHQVQVSQPIAVRQRVAAHMALRIAPPLLLLLPVMALLIWIVVGRSMRPLQRLTQAVRGRSPSALQPLDDEGLPPELRPIVLALNSLLQKVDHAMSVQRTFVADAAHELRSPLTALKLQLQLAERAGSDESRETSFRKLHERLDRSTHLVQQLLTLARQEQPRDPPRTDCDLLGLAQQVVADHAIYAESRRIDLGVAADALAVRATVQLEGMAVLLSNLVDNALRYTQPGGQVDVATGLEQGRPWLRVVDNGPGVPAEERERLFDRFYRPDGNAVWGCGLGMSIVKSVADAHGALVRLDANPAGTGLMVTVVLSNLEGK
ncbi:ATP-binding protein [Duganella hordei]|uniref:ATP-binding protein n=1 Tax=Duganella hordei TaxID=2865934 RepID=UPI0030EA8827